MAPFRISHRRRWWRNWNGFHARRNKRVRLDCEEILFRIALNARCVAPDNLEAFLLKPTDRGKLSVYRLRKTSYEDCSRHYNRPKGAFTLHVGWVRTVTSRGAKLDVIEDVADTDRCPGHASILNMPDPSIDSEAEEAEHVASLLRDQSRTLVSSGKL